ncbi:MAG: hypothetical protein GKS03_05835 [Alphaproteobacteria bacterium]|nr:hypothetical protein [Alphaproteobacteria bacterium]
MTLSQSTDKQNTVLAGSMPAARVIFGLIALAFLIHLGFFAIGVGPTALEAYYGDAATGSSFYTSLQTLLRALFVDSIGTGRVFSMMCAMSALVLLARLCASWSGDVVVGAAIPLGVLMFPQTAFTLALATPHALLMLLTVVGFAATRWVGDREKSVAPLSLGVVCVALVFLAPSGLGVAAAIIVFVCFEGRGRTFLAMLAATICVVGFLLSLWFPIPLSASPPFGLVETNVLTLQDGLWRAFAMLWVALVLSAAALLGSVSLRQCIGRDAVRRSMVLGLSFAVSLLWLIFGVASPPADLPVLFTAVLVLGVVAALPLVLWVRLVMPSIQSVWIWILLPVLMYSCFWVVLGPINLAAFPYDQIEARP